jgi:hypothetical protein
MKRTLLTFTFSAAALLATTASAAVLRNEATGGDLSGNRNAPTQFTTSLGSNEIFATTAGGDLEYFTLTVPANQQLSRLFLRSYSGPDGTAFIAVQNGAVFTEDAAFPNQANLRGWAHFGSNFGHVGNDILPLIGQGAGAQGFTPPLGPGQYTFWVQQTGAQVTYQLDFVTVPEPGVAILVSLSLLALARRRVAC